MFVSPSEIFHSIKIWIFDIAELILFLSVVIAIVVKTLLFLRDFLKAAASKSTPPPQDKIKPQLTEEFVDNSAPET